MQITSKTSDRLGVCQPHKPASPKAAAGKKSQIADNENLKWRELGQFPEYINEVTVRADGSWTENAEKQVGVTDNQCSLETSLVLTWLLDLNLEPTQCWDSDQTPSRTKEKNTSDLPQDKTSLSC